MQQFIPYKHSSDGLFHWLCREGVSFTEPFFDDTVTACKQLRRPEKTSTAAQLAEWAALADAVPPTAFIFHVSRCGSTLLSQMLALDTHNIVLSEPPIIDALLPHDAALVPAALAMLGQRQQGNEERLFVKTDSWHLCFYDTLRILFPAVPFVLLYRDPAAVLRSQQQRRGRHAVPGLVPATTFGWEPESVQPFSLDAYLCKVLDTYYQQMLTIARQDTNTLLLNYDIGPQSILELFCAFTGTPLSVALQEAAYTRSRYHGKYPGQPFHGDQPLDIVPDLLQPALEGYTQLDLIPRPSTLPRQARDIAG